MFLAERDGVRNTQVQRTMLTVVCDLYAQTIRSVWSTVGLWDEVIQTKIASDLTPSERSRGNFDSTPRSTFLRWLVPVVLNGAVTPDTRGYYRRSLRLTQLYKIREISNRNPYERVQTREEMLVLISFNDYDCQFFFVLEPITSGKQLLLIVILRRLHKKKKSQIFIRKSLPPDEFLL